VIHNNKEYDVESKDEIHHMLNKVDAMVKKLTNTESMEGS